MKNSACSVCGSKNKSVFCDVSDKALSPMDGFKVCNSYKKGQNLFVQDTPAFGVFCISSGTVKLVQTNEEGKESLLRILKEGDMVGHRSLFSEENYQASAVALEKTEVCFLDKKNFEEMIKQNPEVSLRLLEKLSASLGDSEKRLSAISQNTAKERVAGFLCYLNRAFGRFDEDKRRYLDIQLSREDMASMVGTASETLIRILSEMKEKDWITQEGKRIYIQNLNALLSLAGIED